MADGDVLHLSFIGQPNDLSGAERKRANENPIAISLRSTMLGGGQAIGKAAASSQWDMEMRFVTICCTTTTTGKGGGGGVAVVALFSQTTVRLHLD